MLQPQCCSCRGLNLFRWSKLPAIGKSLEARTALAAGLAEPCEKHCAVADVLGAAVLRVAGSMDRSATVAVLTILRESSCNRPHDASSSKPSGPHDNDLIACLFWGALLSSDPIRVLGGPHWAFLHRELIVGFVLGFALLCCLDVSVAISGGGVNDSNTEVCAHSELQALWDMACNFFSQRCSSSN